MLNISVHELAQNISKSELISFLEKDIKTNIKKEHLMIELVILLKDNEILQRQLYNLYKERFALTSSKVEEILKCSKLERKRWGEKGLINIIGYRDFSKWGKHLQIPLYDRLHIYSIKEKDVETWRENYNINKKTTKKEAVKTGKITKSINDKAREIFKEDFKKLLVSWYKIDSKLGVTYELAFWIVWVSRWAKENQLKAKNAKSKKEKYLLQFNYLYELKNQGIELLLKSNFKTLGFYRPEDCDKYIILSFCKKHYEDWCNERESMYITKWEFFDENKKQILCCKECAVDIIKDYYSLFYLEINNHYVPNLKFGFHTPFGIGKNIFSNLEEIPKISHKEQDGIFRFGRNLFQDEKIIYSEIFVLKKFTEVVEKYKLYYSN